MSGTAVLATIIVVLAALALAINVFVVGRLVRTLRGLRVLVDQLRAETVPMVSDLRATVRQAGDDLERVESVLDKAETIATTVDAASRLTYRALRPPLVRTMAFVSGASRATRRLRGRGRGAINVPATAVPVTDVVVAEDVDGRGARHESGPDQRRRRLRRRRHRR